MSPRSSLFRLQAVAMMFLAAGCGGGGSSSTAPTSTVDFGLGGGGSLSNVIGGPHAAEGAWTSRCVFLWKLDCVGGRGIVAQDGFGYFTTYLGNVLMGPVRVDSQGTLYSKLVTYLPLNGEVSLGRLTAQDDQLHVSMFITGAEAHTVLTAASRGVGNPTSSSPLLVPIWGTGVTFDYLHEYDQPAQLTTLAGVYTNDSPSYVLTLSVNADGQINGSDTTGCALVGNASIPDPKVNVYQAEADVSSCGVLDGHYAGIFSITDDDWSTPENRALILAMRSVSPVDGATAIFHVLHP